MSRCGYTEDGENWSLIKWRGQVASAIRGKRGQAFLRDLLEALDAMPQKRLIAHELRQGPLRYVARDGAVVDKAYITGEVCTLGAIGARRNLPIDILDPEDYDTLAGAFGIAHQLIQEIEWVNDDLNWNATPEQRWLQMRQWIVKNLKAKSKE